MTLTDLGVKTIDPAHSNIESLFMFFFVCFFFLRCHKSQWDISLRIDFFLKNSEIVELFRGLGNEVFL